MPALLTVDKITLRKDVTAGCWLAEHAGPRAAKIVDLFSTATLPTPFRCSYPAEWVADTLRKLNPGAIVEIEEAR